ncbi:EpsG family protein, partial [Salinivibrio sp. IB872]|uniref:EpsG family protein n=1 Tax=Salinivibrio sp. IB872 TaxID=1766123 RepID=UPI0009CD796F
MAPYFFVFGWLAFFSVMENYKQFNKLKPFFYTATVIILVLFAGFRKAGVGADDLNYIEKFLEIPSFSSWLTGEFIYSFSETRMEPGYLLIGSMIREFSTSYVYLFLSIASISIGLASLNYYRYSKYVFLALTLFFVHTFLYRDINQIRSAIAAAIGLFLI